MVAKHSKYLFYLPVVMFSWYPSVFGKIPLLPIFCILLFVYKFLIFKKVNSRKENNGLYAILGVLTFLAFSTFVVQSLLGYNINRTTEIYIFSINFIFSPLIFFLISNEKDLDEVWLIRAFTFSALFFIWVAIYRDVGFSINNFDAQNSRILLPFVVNSLASPTVSAVLVYMFALNVYLLVSKGGKKLTFISLLLIVLEIYIISSRYAMLVVVATMVYYLYISNVKIKLRAFGLGLVGLVLAITLSGVFNVRVNDRFLADLQSFERVSSPLSDASFVIRVSAWIKATSHIPNYPTGYGYLRFVYNNYILHDTMGTKGFNTHNELLLQLLGIGWIPTMILVYFIIRLCLRVVSGVGLPKAAPFLIAFFLSSTFVTYSNGPNSINVWPLVFFIMGMYLNKCSSEKELPIAKS